MATLADLIALTVAQTRRPEIPDITAAAVKSAVLRAHHTDFFPRDLAEHQWDHEVSSSAIFYDLQNMSTVIERVRSLSQVQMIEPPSQAPVEELEYREGTDLYLPDGSRRLSVYTLKGDTLRIYPIRGTGSALISFYQNPNIPATGAVSSWIVDTYPDEVALWAAAIVFARTGFEEMAKSFQESHIRPFKDLLVASHLFGNVS